MVIRFQNESKVSDFLRLALLGAVGATLAAGCGKRDDSIAKAEKKDADKPGIGAIKDIAKKAYIYGFPMLMNYGVMYAYFIDRNSGLHWDAQVWVTANTP